MRNILIISRREVTRLRSRFPGKSRLVVLAVLAISLVTGLAVYQQDMVIARDMYVIGAGAGAPPLDDARFNRLTMDFDAGLAALEAGDIDVYMYEDRVFITSAPRSQYATSALKQHLGGLELDRIAQEYDLAEAFPLRVEVREMASAGSSEDGPSLSDILESTEPAVVSDTGEKSENSSATSIESSDPGSAGQNGPGSLTEPPDEGPAHSSHTDQAVRDQLEERKGSRGLPEFNAEFVSDQDIIVPSLMTPPTPLAQVILAFLYVVPLFFVSVFFTSSFMEEKTNRKLIILMSAPVTPLQVIIGKMLPYLVYGILCVIGITLVLGGSVPAGLAIFTPVMLFIMAIYLMVALLYRTFKDQTFFSVLAVWVITAYLVAPAMFSGVSNLSYISPLTLAVQMYQGESFGITQYLLSTTPMYLIFAVAVFLGTRMFNEEFLMGFRPLHRKIGEAVYLAVNKDHLSLSIFFLSLCAIPLVFMVQLASIVVASNLPMPASLWALFAVSIVVEEVAKSTGIVVLIKNGIIRSRRALIMLSLVSALGFLLGEKLLLYLAMSVVSQSLFIEALFSAGLLVAPMLMHFVATAVVCLTTARLGVRFYPLAILAGGILHAVYNLYIIGEVL